MTDQELVSVVIPVYNAERYVGAAIESVLAQGHGRVEIIAVDDGSTDGSVRVIESFEPAVRVLRQENAGVGGARNSGIAVAQGELLAFLDADDLWAPDKLARQLAALNDDPELDFVLGQCHEFVDGEDTYAAGGVTVPGNVMGAMLVRTKSFQRVGMLSSEWKIGEYIDWYGRAMDAGLRVRMLPETVLLRRLHGDNLGRREAASRLDYARVLRATLARRRAAEARLD